MKKQLMITLMAGLMLAACNKSEPEKTNTVTEYVKKPCKLVKTLSLDANGVIYGTTINYYTNDRLDSTVSTPNNNTTITKQVFTYSDKNNRMAKVYYNNVLQAGYSNQTLDEYGNVIRVQSYDANGNRGYGYTQEYSCN